jgi:hypothetical protein
MLSVPAHNSSQAFYAQPSRRTQISQFQTLALKGLTQCQILACCLHQPDRTHSSIYREEALHDAVIVCLDAEWYEHSPTHITELGISISIPDIVNSDSSNWESPWKVMRHLLNFHVRIKPNAHLVNSELCPGYPHAFQFGRTSFVDVVQARELLKYAFYHMNEKRKLCPIVLVGHAVDNDVQILKDAFDFDVEDLGVVVATLDTQVMARELGLAEPGRKIRLSGLLAKYGISEPFLHNAGNNTVATMIAAMLMAYKTAGGDYSYLYANYKKFTQVGGGHKGRDVGDFVWCTRCESDKHFASHCRIKLHCGYCAERGMAADTHALGKCREVVKDRVAGARKVVAVPPTPVVPTLMPRIHGMGFAVP